MFRLPVLLAAILTTLTVRGQQDLLLNGNFEEINTCTEYGSECGVEGWFYLKEVKAQMLSHENPDSLLGNNSFQIYYNWKNDPGFTPVIGSLLPCRLQAGHEYIFRGLISATLNPKLSLTPAVAIASKFYVPGRPFSRSFKANVITDLRAVPNSTFFRFEYTYTATGTEDYLTFGSFVSEDTVAGKRAMTGVQTIAITLDGFSLTSTDPSEGACESYDEMKSAIYSYNFRHKQMDYPLFATGEIKVTLPVDSLLRVTRKIKPAPQQQWRTERLNLDNISFAFDKADLKDSTSKRLGRYFSSITSKPDSIAIEGHTDSVGSNDYNLSLSRLRCESVSKWIVAHGISATRGTSIRSFGSTRPVAPNSTPEGRSRNRRVEIIIYWKEGTE